MTKKNPMCHTQNCSDRLIRIRMKAKLSLIYNGNKYNGSKTRYFLQSWHLVGLDAKHLKLQWFMSFVVQYWIYLPDILEENVRTGLEWSWCCQDWIGMVLMLSELVWNGPDAVRTGLEWSWCCQDWAGMVLVLSGLGWNGPGAVRTGLEWSWCCQNWSGMVLMLSGLGWNGPGAVRTGLEWSWCCQDWAGMVLMLSELGWNGSDAVRTGLEWFWCCQDWVGKVLGPVSI